MFLHVIGPRVDLREVGHHLTRRGRFGGILGIRRRRELPNVSSRWARTTQIPVGLIVLGVGLVLVTASMVLVHMPMLVAGGIVAGVGVGVTFKAAIGTLISIALAETRGEGLAWLFLVGYLGMAVPVLLRGLVLQAVALIASVMMFGGFMLVLLAITAITFAKTRHQASA